MTQLTYEESLDKIQRIHEAIDEALESRDYEKAKVFQDYLKQHEIVHARLFSLNRAEQIQKQLSFLEAERLQKERILVQKVIEKLNNIRENFEHNYSDLEQRHLITMENLRSQFRKPSFTNMRKSSAIRQLSSAENYYAKIAKDYQTAAQIKRQIDKQLSIEQEEFNRSTGITIEAKMKEAINHYKTQQMAFAQRLLNQKNLLKKDVRVQILGMENHYRKMIYNLSKTTKGERCPILLDNMDITSSFEKDIMSTIDTEFNQFVQELQQKYQRGKPIVSKNSNTRTKSSNIKKRSASVGSINQKNRKTIANQNINENQRKRRNVGISKHTNANSQKQRKNYNVRENHYENYDTEDLLFGESFSDDDQSGISSNDLIKIEDIDFDNIRVEDIRIDDDVEVDIFPESFRKQNSKHTRYIRPSEPMGKNQYAPRRFRSKCSNRDPMREEPIRRNPRMKAIKSKALND